MHDVPTKENKPFKWVGTRPVRPDGVPKVTGRALYGSDFAMPGLNGLETIRRRHTCAHRVDELLGIVDEIKGARPHSQEAASV